MTDTQTYDHVETIEDEDVFEIEEETSAYDIMLCQSGGGGATDPTGGVGGAIP